MIDLDKQFINYDNIYSPVMIIFGNLECILKSANMRGIFSFFSNSQVLKFNFQVPSYSLRKTIKKKTGDEESYTYIP